MARLAICHSSDSSRPTLGSTLRIRATQRQRKKKIMVVFVPFSEVNMKSYVPEQ